MIDQYILQAKNVAASLLERSKKNGNRIQWKIERRDKLNTLLRANDYSLADGIGGIILFYLELYQVTQEEHYLSIANRSMRGLLLILKNEPSRNFGFFNGKMGVVYVLLRMYEITNDNYYLTEAFNIAVTCGIFLDSDQVNASLIEGSAGVVLILLQLYQYKGSDELEKCLSKGIQNIISKAHYVNSHISWYTNFSQVDNHCGFGYGTAGISYVLNVVGSFVKNETFNELSVRAMSYCDNSWSRTIKNWPDFNFTVETPEEDFMCQRIFRNARSMKQLLQGRNSIDYTNGSIGILLSKLLTVNKGPDPSISSRVKDALKNTVTKQLRNLSIVDISALSTVISLCDNGKYYNDVFSVIPKANNMIIENPVKLVKGNALSLRSGLAGLGYHYLVLSNQIQRPYYVGGANLQSNQIRNIKCNSYFLKLSRSDLDQLVIGKYFPKTLALLERKQLQSISKWIMDYKSKNLVIDFLTFLIKYLDNHSSPLIKENLLIEQVKYKMGCTSQKSVYFFIRKATAFLLNRKLQELKDDEILKIKFRLADDLKIVRSRIYIDNGDGTKSKGITTSLLTYSDQREFITQTRIGGIDQLLIHFKKPMTGSYLLNSLIQQSGKEEQREIFKDRIVELILTYVQDAVLFPAGRKPLYQQSNI